MKSARSAEIFPFLEKFSVGIEYLKSLISAVGNVNEPVSIDLDRMRNVEFTCVRTFPASGFNVISVSVELHHRLGSAAQHENMTFRVDRNARYRAKVDARRKLERFGNRCVIQIGYIRGLRCSACSGQQYKCSDG